MGKSALYRGAAATALAALLTATAAGHVPVLSDGTAVDPNTALEFANIQISRTIYHEITPSAPEVWIAFSVGDPQEVKMRFSVPQIERLADYRPAFALLGPGLPEADPNRLPFDVPEGLGVRTYTFGGVDNPEEFYEPFSATTAWTLYNGYVTLPTAGRYYLVGYHPEQKRGKLLMALAIAEEWSDEELAELPENIERVREFFELPPDADPPCFLVGLAGIGLSLVGMIRSRRG